MPQIAHAPPGVDERSWLVRALSIFTAADWLGSSARMRAVVSEPGRDEPLHTNGSLIDITAENRCVERSPQIADLPARCCNQDPR